MVPRDQPEATTLSPGDDARADGEAASLAGYELPRDLRIIDAIPRTHNGKVDRPAVAALFS